MPETMKRDDGRTEGCRPAGTDHVVVVTDSSLNSVRESKPVDQASGSGSGSFQAGYQSSQPESVGESPEATSRMRRKMARVE